MASKTVFEQISGELVREGKLPYPVKLDLKIKELFVNESSSPVSRAIATMDLARISGRVEDGNYLLRYVFAGEQQEGAVRVQYGRLLARRA